MNFIIAKIVLLSFVFMTAACGEKEAEAKNEEVSQEKKGDGKAPLSQFKAVPPRDKSTYKSPKF